MLIATTVTASGTALAGLAAVLSALVTLRSCRRRRQAPVPAAEHPSRSLARLAEPAVSAVEVGRAALNEPVVVIIVQGHDIVGRVALLKDLERDDRAQFVSRSSAGPTMWLDQAATGRSEPKPGADSADGGIGGPFPAELPPSWTARYWY